MQHKDILQEFFDLDDLKAGAENLRDVSKQVYASIAGIVRDLAQPFKVLFTFGNEEKLKKTLEKYNEAERKYRSETNARLRNLGVLEGPSLDLLVYSPTAFLATAPVSLYKFMKDDPGADEMNPFYEKMLRDLSDSNERTAKSLSALEKIFFESKDAIDQLISEQTTSQDFKPENVEELFSFFGFDIKQLRDAHFDNLTNVLEQTKQSLETRLGLLQQMKNVKDEASLTKFTQALANAGADVDVSKISKQVDDLKTKNPEADDLQQVFTMFAKDGVKDLKASVKKFLQDLDIPDEEVIKSSKEPRAKAVMKLIEDIKSLASKF